MRFVATLVVAASVLASVPSGAQVGPPKLVASFSGMSVKWMLIAQPEFDKWKLNLDGYNVEILEGPEFVWVALCSFDAVEGVRGSSGSLPGFELEIRKKDSKVIRANYVR